MRIFGGGIGLRPTETELASLDQAAADGKTYGQVGGNTNVNVEYGVVVKDVFGGGAGVESKPAGNDGKYVDFPNMALVKGKTNVHVHATNNQPTQTLVYGRVFGGGDVANVGQDVDAVTTNMQSTDVKDVANEEKLRTKVTVDAGCVFGDVFAGGSGRRSENCNNYANLGAVYGNTQLVISQPKTDGGNSTWLWKDVYGGGRNGIVKGNTLVEIEGGWLGSNVYGGGLGNVGSRYNLGTGMDEEVITAANVTQNTNVQITGGQYCLSQMWNEVERSWAPINKDDKDNKYSSQYDPTTNKFFISHNIYGGGNVACTVGNDTWVDMTKGLLPEATSLGHKETANFFTENEWKNIHNKHASPYFSVFGGGYGGKTEVANDTHVNIAMEAQGAGDEYKPSNYQSTSNLSSVFLDRQSLLDVIGGGYEGSVTNTCNVEINGNTFMRNVFGGAYYATVGGTKVDIKQGNIEDVYGGGMMGDVRTNALVNVGQEGLPSEIAASNKQIVILKNVYGANDVSGLVGGTEDEFGAITPTPGCDGVVMKLYGGTVCGNVYGSGNGNYQYKLDQDVTKVTPLEDYHFTVGGRNAVETVYLTPVRQTNFPSLGAMSSAQKIVDITSYRPGVSKVKMDIKGNSETDRLVVKSSIFGGGNSATVSTFALKDDGVTPDYGVKMNLGSHVRANSLFFGSDGQELFNTENYFIANFEALNGLQLKSTIDWEDVRNIDISNDFLPVAADKRPDIFKTLLDLYFLPVEMDFMPEFTWNEQNNSVKVASGEASYAKTTDFEDTELGTFCCGGNRGNMNTETNFHVNFPEGLTITDKIVGGCNNANYKFLLDGEYDSNGVQKSKTHEGGYLLGTHHVGLNRVPQIHLTLRNKFRIEETAGEYLEACNVFGGCYESGTVRGDILVEVFSNMLHSAGTAGGGLNVEKLKAANSRNEDPNAERTNSVASVYGGGYGPNTWVYGDTEVRLGNNTDEHESVLAAHETQFIVTGSSCNFLFGGGCQGNIVGNTNVRMYNGRVAGCIVGASFKGSLYGNAQTMVGYPARYYRANKTGVFKLVRTDNSSDHADYRDENGNKIIRTEVYYTEGDLVPRVVYDEIVAEITEEMDEGGNVSWTETPLDDAKKAALFTMEHSIPGEEYKTTEPEKFNNWSNINIHIDKAIYGGGYAIMNGENSDPFTVKKYTDIPKEGDDRTYRFSNTQIEDTYHVVDPRLFNHYGGNTFVMLGDISGDYEKQAVADGESALAAMSTRDGSNPNVITTEGQRNKDHINISSRSLDPVSTSTGDDLFGLFYEMTNEERYGADYCSVHSLDKDAPSGSYMKMSYEAFKQASDQHQYYNFVGEGGVYGDGRLSLSEGFRTCEAIGYGYNGSTPEEPKLMNCIHRFDISRFKDCCISLLGDRDYASAEGQMPTAASYSIARVSEIVMESSIDQRYDYLPKNLKFSRNYIGLSNAQFDLAAIRSNVDFKPVNSTNPLTENAYYHNKHGEVVVNGMDVEGSENDHGVAQTHFDDVTGYYDVKRWYLNEYKIGLGKSDYYDNVIAQVKNEKLFQLRNSATSKNMFGVFSGYALTVQNNYYDNTGSHPYWGPVKGVFEIDLIGTRNGEAGGYAYAQNIHEEIAKDGENDVKDSEGNSVHSFLETSGNFVFPANETRKVVDNCFPTAYSSEKRDFSEGHYWYVTGFRYFYNVNITGYTYDNDVRYFNMENSSHLIFMPGAKAGQDVTVQNFHFLGRHSSTEKQKDCDIDNKFLSGEYNSDRWKEPTAAELLSYCVEGTCSVHDGTGNHDDDRRAYWNERSRSVDFNNPFYNLSLSVSDRDVYSSTTEKGDAMVTVPHYESLIQDKFTMVPEDDGKGGTVDVKKYEEQNYVLDGTIPYNEPLISLQLKDVVKNNGMFDETTTYKDKYLSEPCQALLVLTTPVVNERGQYVYDAYEPVPKKGTTDVPDLTEFPDNKYSVLDFNGDYIALNQSEAQTQYNNGAILYTKASAKMLKVGDGSFMSDRYYFTLNTSGNPDNIGTLAEKDYDKFEGDDNTGDWTIRPLTRDEFNALTDEEKANLYYLRPNAKTRFYEYNLTITINYLKGPSHKGNINILNCALPGEMIRLRHNNIKIDTDPVSLRHNGNFWIIGPGKKVADSSPEGYHWELLDPTGTKDVPGVDAEGTPIVSRYYDENTRNFYYPYNPWVDKADEDHYMTPIGSAVRDGMYHDTEDTNKPDYYIPAYYFMNGYVAQYAYTVANINEIFVTTAYPMDTLLVHNYHRMLKANVETDRKDDIKLREAVLEMMDKAPLQSEDGLEGDELTAVQAENEKMRKQWANQHKRPRVYIQNQNDLVEFKNFVERTANRTNSAGRVVLPATDYGNGIDFFLLADITVPNDWTPITKFMGALHGNGHVINGLGNKALFRSIDAANGAHIYNLGLPEGKIVSTEVPAAYSNCYTYANKTVYRMDGTAVGTTADGAGNTYTDDDWRYGRVAYDLNEYYLAERLDRGVHEVSESTNNDTHNHSGYVEDLYGDGEYRLALYRLKDETETEYLRNQQEPNYQWGFDNDMVSAPDAISNHWYEYDEENRVLSHRVDEPRAYYTEAVPAVLYANVGEYNTAKGTSLDAAAFAALTDAQKTKTAAKPRMVSEFRPLIDEVKVNSTEEGLATKKNDYIFFGQTLNVSAVTAAAGTVGTSLPAVISASANASMPGNSNNDGGMPVVTHNVNDQANRVWRTYGFYQSKKDDAFHFNRAAWALHKELTAVDFIGAHDANHTWAAGMVGGDGAVKEKMFYPMPMDVPKDNSGVLNLTSFNVMSNRNYNENGTTRAYDNSNYGAVTQNLLVYNNGESAFAYTDVNNRLESDVQYHNIVKGSDPATYSTDYFHLVDKQDFNAPIAFNVNKRAWYERLPQAYRNVGGGYGAGSAWEGIVLPFTATKVTAEKNGEISHFYGDDERHHEYWLRGLTAVDGANATFARPAVSGSGNFMDTKQSGTEYTYPKNKYFTSLFDYNNHLDTREDEFDDEMEKHDLAWYAEDHTFKDYVHLAADVPYIVAFPGDDFYEFSMESYYKTDKYVNESYKQKATFEVNSDDPDIVATTIKVSDDNEAMTDLGASNVHWGTFLHMADQLGINKDGTAFESVPVSYNDGYVLPFRTYLGAVSSPVKRYVISEPGKGDQPFEPNEPNANDNRPVFDISIDGLNVTVTSSYEDTRILDVYMVGGQLVLRHEAVPGTTHFRLPQQGAYIIGRKKYMVR
ncbi:MAG: hypothetical protein KBT39_10515 [Bacteroidales bacterium]|nr:hypothetical protein [Bacteroidales bacterium]